MRILKISAVATLVTMLAWRARFPQKIWPKHSQVALFLIAIAMCVLLQFVWSEDEPAKTDFVKSDSPKAAGAPAKKFESKTETPKSQ